MYNDFVNFLTQFYIIIFYISGLIYLFKKYLSLDYLRREREMESERNVGRERGREGRGKGGREKE